VPYPLLGQLTPGTSSSLFVQPGPFVFQSVTPGEYRVTALGRQWELAFSHVVVNAGDSPRIALTVSSGTTLRGRVVFEPGDPVDAAQARAVQLTITPMDRAPLVGPGPPPVAGDGTFVLQGVHSRRILLRASAPGWALESVSLNGFDVTDDPIQLGGKSVDGFEIVLTRPRTEIAGTVTTARGAGVAHATVVLFADDPDKWGPGTRFTGTATTDAQGRFAIRGLPAARYVAVAVEDLEAGDDTNPDALQSWRASGTRITVGDGGTHAVQLRIF
jgi:hypothetical protein